MVLGTTRLVYDHVSIEFTRHFYRTLAEGYPVEMALIAGRKAIKNDNWDWTAFTLFAEDSSIKDLTEFRMNKSSEVR